MHQNRQECGVSRSSSPDQKTAPHQLDVVCLLLVLVRLSACQLEVAASKLGIQVATGSLVCLEVCQAHSMQSLQSDHRKSASR